MDKELQDTIARVRRLSLEPDFHAHAEEYMAHRYVFDNTDQVCGNTRPLYDPIEQAITYLKREQPELFAKFDDASRATESLRDGKPISKAELAGKIALLVGIITWLNEYQGNAIPQESIALLNIIVNVILLMLQ